MDDWRESLQVRYVQYGAVGLALAILFAAAGSMTGFSERLHAERAVEEFMAGDAAERGGDCAAAIEHFRVGLELAGDESSYRLSLARCLWREGRGTEADTYLSQVLAENPTDGEANLLRAQVLADGGAVNEAVTYFQRAITGGWPEDADGRFRARSQLVALLYQEARWRDLVPQLLQLREEPQVDQAQQIRIAEMFREAGAPDETRDILTELVRAGVRRADVYAMLGHAYLELRMPVQAQQSLDSARLLAAGDPWVEADVAFADAVVELDPDEPGLSDSSQHRRLIEVGQISVERARRCAGGAAPGPFTTEAAATLDRAARRPASASADRLRALAVAVWQRSAGTCNASTVAERAAEYVIAGAPEPEPVLSPAESGQ